MGMTPWWIELATVPAVALCAYIWLIFVLRVAGKRSLAKLNAFDLAVTVAFGSAFATIIMSPGKDLARGALALAMLALLQYSLTRLSIWSRLVRETVRSQPTLLAEDGKIYREALRQERITLDEIAEAARKQGVGRMDEVGALILETDGSLSLVARSDQPLDLLYDVRRIGAPSAHPGAHIKQPPQEQA